LEMNDPEIRIKYKIWLQKKTGEDIFGKGGANLLKAIDQFHDLGKATKIMKCSYKYAWNILQKIKERYGENPVITHRGGLGGGGGIELSDFGRKLLRLYTKFESYIETALKNSDLWQTYGLHTEVKNDIRGKVVDIQKDSQVAILKIEITPPQDIYSIITSESVKDLELKEGKEVLAIIKATEVLVSNEKEASF
ncbi:MAG: TOBE domain-containing protein, partial [Candidatus Helarchaeota archaeon]|nr:TOBE domain-containing protein [Candidatus Helarchaeota archaeon]